MNHNSFEDNPSDIDEQRIQEALNSHTNVRNSFPNLDTSNNDIEGLQDSLLEEAEEEIEDIGTMPIESGQSGEADSDIDLESKSPLLSSFLGTLGFNSKSMAMRLLLKHPTVRLAVFTILIFIVFVIFLVVMLGSGREEPTKKPIGQYLSYGTIESDDGENKETLIKYLQREGFCKGYLDCLNSNAYKFYNGFRKKIVSAQQEYTQKNISNQCTQLGYGGITLDTHLLLATISYRRSDEELVATTKSKDYDKQLKIYEDEMDALIQAMIEEKEEEITVTEIDFSGRIVQNNKTVSCYQVTEQNYKKNIVGSNEEEISGYLSDYRNDILFANSYIPYKESIYSSILEEAKRNGSFLAGGNSSSSSNNVAGNYYTECTGVTVVDRSGNIVGTYSLDEYVAGVVDAEIYSTWPTESHKALAVAARTYVLNRTNSCKAPIESSSRLQNFDPNPEQWAIDASNATAGQILTYNGKIFAAEYDSWNCPKSNTCTYSKKPGGEQHTVTISDTYLSKAAGGHGRGMSQVAAADMALHGSSYDEILKYFYSDNVVINNLTSLSNGIISGGKYTSTSPIPKNTDDLFNSQFYPKHARNLGQCVWYARSRAQEILYYSNMPDDLKNTAINSIKNTNGNGEAWYRSPDGNIFAKSTDVSKPRAGAIVSWSGGVTGCGSVRCGHVAIVESVNSDGTIVISEGWKSGDWASTSWSSVKYQFKTVTLDYLRYHTNSSGNPYYFNGYVYLLG